MPNQKAVLYFLLFVFVVCAALYGSSSVSQAQTIPPTDLPTITYDTPTSYLKLCPNCVFLPALQGKESVMPSPPLGGGSILILSSSYNEKENAIWVEVQNITSHYVCGYGVSAEVFLATGESYKPILANPTKQTLAPWEKDVVRIQTLDVPITGYELTPVPGSALCTLYIPAIMQVENVTATKQAGPVGDTLLNSVRVAASNPYTYMIVGPRIAATLYDSQGVVLGALQNMDFSIPPVAIAPGEVVTLTVKYVPEDYLSLPTSIHLKAYGSRLR